MQATQNKELSNVRLLIYFIVSLMFNCLGNALTVALNLGSALWTAAAVNISDVTPVSLSMMLFIFGVLIIITNVILLNKIDVKRIIGNFIFMVPFSTLVGAFSPLLINVGITSLHGGRVHFSCNLDLSKNQLDAASCGRLDADRAF